MDLSQQELPLTAYFTRGNKGARPRTVQSRKKGKPPEDSVAHSSKRRKSSAQCPTAVGQSESTLQLPTPAASTRKRKRHGHLEIATSVSEEDLLQLEFGPTLSKWSRSLRAGAEDTIPKLPSIPFATPSTDRRKTIPSVGIEFPSGIQYSSLGETGIATPRTSSQRMSASVHRIDDGSPLLRSKYHLPSNQTQTFSRLGKSHTVLSHVQFSARPTASLSSLPVDLDCSDPFRARDSGFLQQDRTFALPKQNSVQLDGQPSDGHAVPMIPIPSSQSQYLLHLDATPKRKRCPRVEAVISSQTQEERELTLSTPHRPATSVDLSVEVSRGKHTVLTSALFTPVGNAQIPRLNCGERKTGYALGSTPVGSPNSFATKNALDEPSSKFSCPSRRERLASYRSPSHKTKRPQRSRQDSVENIPPAHIEDSLTESESESDILQMKLKAKISMFGSPARDVRCEGNLPGAEDGSATEIESDTDILHCVAEIGKKRFRDRRSQVAKDVVLPPVISPLVSPARSRIAATPSITGSTQFCTQGGHGSSIPGSFVPHPLTTEQPRILPESLPSVVRDFIRMFPGDESYPADFPESLRV